MNTIQLWYALSSHPVVSHYFKGVYARDQIPYIHTDEFIICNTDTSDEPGEHWLAIYRPDERHVEFFDSLGKSPSDYFSPKDNIMKQISNYSICMLSNRVQPPSSNLCGEYCLFYAHARLQGECLKNIEMYIPSSQTLRFLISCTYIILNHEFNIINNNCNQCACYFY